MAMHERCPYAGARSTSIGVQVALGFELVIKLHELELCIVVGHAFQLVPCIPTFSSLEVDASFLCPHGLFGIVIAHFALLREGIELVENRWTLEGSTGHGNHAPLEFHKLWFHLFEFGHLVIPTRSRRFLGLGLLLLRTCFEAKLLQLGPRRAELLTLISGDRIQEGSGFDGLFVVFVDVLRSAIVRSSLRQEPRSFRRTQRRSRGLERYTNLGQGRDIVSCGFQATDRSFRVLLARHLSISRVRERSSSRDRSSRAFRRVRSCFVVLWSVLGRSPPPISIPTQEIDLRKGTFFRSTLPILVDRKGETYPFSHHPNPRWRVSEKGNRIEIFGKKRDVPSKRPIETSHPGGRGSRGLDGMKGFHPRRIETWRSFSRVRTWEAQLEALTNVTSRAFELSFSKEEEIARWMGRLVRMSDSRAWSSTHPSNSKMDAIVEKCFRSRDEETVDEPFLPLFSSTTSHSILCLCFALPIRKVK